MTQIERISYYEKLLKEATAALKKYEKALDAYIDAQKKVTELERYYVSPEWKKDFEDSENGKLPPDLPCGVLSEDGIDHLLENNMELYAQTRTISEQIGK